MLEREETEEGIGQQELTDGDVSGGSEGTNVLVSLPRIDRGRKGGLRLTGAGSPLSMAMWRHCPVMRRPILTMHKFDKQCMSTMVQQQFYLDNLQEL